MTANTNTQERLEPYRAPTIHLTTVGKTQVELELEDCRAEIIRLRRTLKFYANPKHWLLGPGLWEWIGPDSDPMAPWSTAQAALEEGNTHVRD